MTRIRVQPFRILALSCCLMAALSRTLANGELVVVAKRVLQADGSPSPLTGARLFVNQQPDGSGFWTAIDAPVQVPDIVEKNACQNYSSALLPAPDGSSVLELAADFAPGGACTVYARRGRLDGSGS